MKKFFSMMLVALVAMVGFVSCGESEMTDDELKTAIIEKGLYYGQISAENTDYDGIWVSAVFENDMTYKMYMTETRREAKKDFAEDDLFDNGTWVVSEGKLVITDEEGTSATYELSKKGKRITVSFANFNVVLD